MKVIGVSPGMALGNVIQLSKPEYIFPKAKTHDYEIEFNKFIQAKEETLKELVIFKEKAIKRIGVEESGIFDAHYEIANDPQILNDVTIKLKEGAAAISALKEVTDHYIDLFENLEDQYFKERAFDIDDVRKRMYRKLMGIKEIDLSNLPPNALIVAYDLTPSDTTSMNLDHVVGFVTEVGGFTSHTAIIARNLGIPAIMGVTDVCNQYEDKETLFIDGSSGLIEKVKAEERETYMQKVKANHLLRLEIDKAKHLEAITLDNRKIDVFANIGNSNEAQMAFKEGAKGVGLFRTEFLYMESDHLPTEEEQFLAYKQAIDHMEGQPIIFRTLDIGGDKEISYFHMPEEMNPFLGYRAIRFCFDELEVFKTQLRALIRASQQGDVWVMFPMISSIDEILRLKGVLKEVEASLKGDGYGESYDYKFGIMVEIPSVAVMASHVAEYVDFMSIGTNDLTQYTLACDRGNEMISNYYDSYNPGVLSLINHVIAQEENKDIMVGMCGELAGDPLATMLLLGMGLTEFSMSPKSMNKIKSILTKVTYEECKGIADHCLKMSRSCDVKAYLKERLEHKSLGYLLSC